MPLKVLASTSRSFQSNLRQTDLKIQAYSSLGSSSSSVLIRNSVVNSIARKLDVSPAQVFTQNLFFLLLNAITNTRCCCAGHFSGATVCYQSRPGVSFLDSISWSLGKTAFSRQHFPHSILMPKGQIEMH